MSHTHGINTHNRLTMLISLTEQNQESLPGSEMDETDSIIANVGVASVPSQIHQLASALLGHSQQ